MIGNSFLEYVFIRICIAGLRLVAPTSILYLGISAWNESFPISKWLGLVAIAETGFYLAVYLPRKKGLQAPPRHAPPPLTKPQRQALFEKCASDIEAIRHLQSDPYPTGWFLPPNQTIKRDDAVDWLLWALFSCKRDEALEEWTEELDGYLKMVEEMLGRKLEQGRGEGVRSMRLTFDPVKVAHRPLIWYSIVGLVDGITSLSLLMMGFKHYSSPKWFQMFPPRPLLTLFSRRAEVSPEVLLPYWYRPHRSTKKQPILFIHGIGIGLHPYIPFIREIIARDPDIGILLIELLPISMHITSQPVPPRPLILKSINDILISLNISRVVLAAHSYGTYVRKITHTILIDPIPILLHLHSVAYNFLYRIPRSAAEWQLWYFASRDADVGRTLGRAFFWEEGGLWGSDLAQYMASSNVADEDSSVYVEGESETARLLTVSRGRNLAIVLAGKDQIVPAETVRRYLTGEPEPSARWVRRGWKSPATSPSSSSSSLATPKVGVSSFSLSKALSSSPMSTLHPSIMAGKPGGSDGGYGTLRDVASEDSGGELEVLFYPDLDHATVFDTKERRKRILDVLHRYVRD
ncbi:hypothetical protein BDZ94DRAFT_887447 [Collybia nuda]|uniref:AB hydrolase-1 domain-containing protein n=1 Tax=Collybia nuda TaxID=64659 RepID=A0A9P5Y1J5_9AGAR|nr:hypothetical protein BDZ94DRAFT_887447 [Collybia nuda]